MYLRILLALALAGSLSACNKEKEPASNEGVSIDTRNATAGECVCPTARAIEAINTADGPRILTAQQILRKIGAAEEYSE